MCVYLQCGRGGGRRDGKGEGCDVEGVECPGNESAHRNCVWGYLFTAINCSPECMSAVDIAILLPCEYSGIFMALEIPDILLTQW